MLRRLALLAFMSITTSAVQSQQPARDTAAVVRAALLGINSRYPGHVMLIAGFSAFDSSLKAAGWDRVPVEQVTEATTRPGWVVNRNPLRLLTTVSEVIYRNDDYAVVVIGHSSDTTNCYSYSAVHMQRPQGKWVVTLTGSASEGCYRRDSK